jgi:hypothetical protein
LGFTKLGNEIRQFKNVEKLWQKKRSAVDTPKKNGFFVDKNGNL